MIHKIFTLSFKLKCIYVLMVLLPLLTLISCSTFSGSEQGEPAAKDDATPPAGYNPFYINRIETEIDSLQLSESKRIEFSRTESGMTRVITHFNICDSNRVLYAKAFVPASPLKICDFVEIFADSERKIDDFEISEITGEDPQRNAIAFVLDHSGSIGDERAKTMQTAIARLIQKKHINDAFALIKYDNRVVVESKLESDTAKLLKDFNQSALAGFGGLTAMMNAMSEGVKAVSLDRSFDNSSLVVITDGLDNSSTISIDSLIASARLAGVNIHTVAFGNNVDDSLLTRIASSTGGQYRHIYQTHEFELLFEDIYKRTRNNYAIEYSPKSYGRHKLRMKICLPGDTMMAETEFDNTPNVGAIELINVYFDHDRSKVKPESRKAIETIVDILKAFPQMEIELRGHTDSTGSDERNTKLSDERTQSVKAEIVRNGIKGSRITCVGFGASMPIASNSTPEGLAKNRRTEFRIKKK